MHKETSWAEAPVLYYHCFSANKKSGGNYIGSRDEYFVNPSCKISTAHVTEDTDDFYRNALGAEYIFIHHGSGVLLSHFGKIKFSEGDQLIIPRATTYQMKFDNFNNNRLLIIESDTAYELPNHYKNAYGQMEEHAPYCERDFRPPAYMEPNIETGEFRIIVKAKERYF